MRSNREAAQTVCIYRHAAPIALSDHGDTFEWRGFYRPAKVQASYEVMIEHGGADWIRKRRAMLDARGARFDGQPVIGVIRPGRTENPRTGLILGLRQVSGQVKSLFNRDEADAICRGLSPAMALMGCSARAPIFFSSRQRPLQSCAIAGARLRSARIQNVKFLYWRPL